MIVGRIRELEALRALRTRVSATNGATALVTGEAGIGKTQLLRAFAVEAEQAGFAVRTGHCFPDAGQPVFAAFSAALRTPFGHDSVATTDQLAIPTLCGAGVMPCDEARLRESCPQVTFGRTVGAGHFHQLEVPDQVNAMLERFIALLPAA